MRMFLFIAVLLLATALAWSAEMAILDGVVKLADGTLCPNIAVEISAGGAKYTVTTDRLGHFGKSVPVGPVEVTAEGVTVKATVSADDWDKNHVELVLGDGEKTQIVFDAAGKPVPNAEVFASYAWQHNAYLIRAVADAQGKVDWKDLPPARAIIWGKGVPAGVMPPGAMHVTTPLPAPVPDEKEYPMALNLPSLPGPPVRIFWMIDPPGANGFITDAGFTRPEGKIRSNYNQFHFKGGTRFNAVVFALTTPPKVAMLSDVYAPYIDNYCDGLDLSWQDGFTASLKLVDAAGKPVPELHHLRMVAEALEHCPVFAGQSQKRDDLLPVTRTGAGCYTVNVPAPGIYQLWGDLYDAATPLRVKLAPAAGTAPVTLPAPLLTLPSGSEVAYLLRASPLVVHRTVLDAETPVAALYGAKESLLAYWTHPAPNKLSVQMLDGSPARELTLRTVYLRFVGTDGKPCEPLRDARLTLTPLIPAAGQPGNSSDASLVETPLIEPMLGYPDGEQRARVTAWTGRYLLTRTGSSDSPTALEIPPTGTNEITVTINLQAQATAAVASTRKVSLQFPPLPEAMNTKEAATVVCLRSDLPQDPGSTVYAPSSGTGAPVTCTVPPAAKTVSVEWIGVGVLRNVPLPPAAGGNAPLALPAWSPGAAIAGRLLMADGTPLANAGCQLADACVANARAAFTTDADGRFTVKGLLPGCFFITQQSTGAWGGWAVTVPEAGLTGLTLRAARRMGISEVPHNDHQYWWMPTLGAPVRLPCDGMQASTYDALEGDGWLWDVSNTGEAQVLAWKPQEGIQNYRRLETVKAAPSIGLSLPLQPDVSPLGTVTLTGVGTCAVLSITFTAFRWRPSSLFGRYFGQIDAVPPGTYRLAVVTTRGLLESSVEVTARGAIVELK